ncbi:Ca2+ regulator and membrane fusion protein Fig1-domain-containing protein [Scheffersomyces coipomensis]|uniref:Ca2+ regulator and membrane fusion protein Fig1-domain-containing protein n=1 Tax=Scheffersomyces coipomensis TaxID=1788519 RepID=UPI00315DE174
MFAFLFKRLPKVLSLVLLFIAIVLLGFLLIGCLDNTNQYSKIYLAQFQFNQTSSDVMNDIMISNSTQTFDSISLKVNYLAVCIDLNQNLTCTTYDKLNNLTSFNDISISPTSSLNLNLISIVKSFSKICHPKVLEATIVLTLVLLLTICYTSIPYIPFKSNVKKFNCVLASGTTLLWGLGSMLQMEAVNTSTIMVNDASMDMVVANRGLRAEAMTWTAFAFIIVVNIHCFYVCFKDVIDLKRIENQKMNSANFSVKV